MSSVKTNLRILRITKVICIQLSMIDINEFGKGVFHGFALEIEKKNQI